MIRQPNALEGLEKDGSERLLRIPGKDLLILEALRAEARALGARRRAPSMESRPSCDSPGS